MERGREALKVLRSIRPDIRDGKFDLVECSNWTECCDQIEDGEQVLIVYCLEDKAADNSYPGALVGAIRARKDAQEDDNDPGIFNVILSDLSRRIVTSAKAFCKESKSKADRAKWDLDQRVEYRLESYHVVRSVEEGVCPIAHVLKLMEDWDKSGNRDQDDDSLLSAGRKRGRNSSSSRPARAAARRKIAAGKAANDSKNSLN